MHLLSSRTDVLLWKKQHPMCSFIPTMGALHEGHLSLIHAAKTKQYPTLVSVFVNPTQFGEGEDFNAYPRKKKEDIHALRAANVDAVWFPSENDIYPNGELPAIPPLPSVFSELEGAVRPTHFLGVAQVLHRFFSIIQPCDVFFGQKDYQQTVLVRWLLKYFFSDTTLHVCPIVREQSGLAMSSRNNYLSPKARKEAAILFSALQRGKQVWDASHNPRYAEREVRTVLENAACIETIDYVTVRDTRTLSCSIANGAVLLVAAHVERVRLLDNTVLSEKPQKISVIPKEKSVKLEVYRHLQSTTE